MGRYYRLSKKISTDQEYEILKEMKEIDDMKSVEITENHELMKVVTKDDEYGEVMGKAVNICRRVAGTLELTFTRFAYEG